MSKILIGVSAYNEEEVILQFLDELKKYKFDIIVVDDNSKDNTFEKVSKNNYNIIRHPINRGVGGSRKTIISYAKQKNYDFIFFMDGDGQHSPKNLKNFLDKKDDFDIVIGQRKILGKDMPIISKISNCVGSFFIFLMSGIFIKDTQSGFRLLNKKAIRTLNLKFDRYEFESEMIIDAKQKNLKIGKCEIDTIYTNYSKNKKQKQKWYRGFLMILRLTLR